MTVPYPDPAFITVLRGLPSLAEVESVSTILSDPLPAIRVTKVRDYEAPSSWEATPIYQIEVWADDYLVAGQLAWAIKNEWPTATAEVVRDAVVHGRWVDSDPFPSPDPETGKARFLISVGIRLSGAASS